MSADDSVIDLDVVEGVPDPKPIRSIFPKDISSSGVEGRSDRAEGSGTGMLMGTTFFLFVSDCILQLANQLCYYYYIYIIYFYFFYIFRGFERYLFLSGKGGKCEGRC